MFSRANWNIIRLTSAKGEKERWSCMFCYIGQYASFVERRNEESRGGGKQSKETSI